ncbi:hypothetical protein OAQ81_04795 [Candidatus Thioglobus sp.]|nr:hypothetical protein [Candidatus Thioglobus sp.]
MFKILFSLFFIFGSASSYAATPACTINANGEVTNDINALTVPVNPGYTTGCYVTPDAVYIPVYRVGLCSSVPTYENYLTECTFVFNSATAKEVEVVKNQAFNVADNITLTEGSYPASVLLLGTTIGYKHTVNFTEIQDGWSDEDSATDGKTCVSRTVSGNADDIGGTAGGGFYECGDSSLTAGKFMESEGSYWDNSECVISNGVVSRPSLRPGSSGLLEYTTSSGSAVICGMADESTHETGGDGNGGTNATRQLLIQTFTDPITISAATSSLEIGLKVTDMLGLEKYMHGGAGYYNAFLDGIELKITALSN